MPHNPDHCTPLKYQYVSHVTLACEDIEHFEEHKVMLAVWDSIFQNQVLTWTKYELGLSINLHQVHPDLRRQMQIPPNIYGRFVCLSMNLI